MRYAVRAAFGLASAPPAGAGLPQSTGRIMPPRRRVAVTRLELGNYDNYFFSVSLYDATCGYCTSR